MSRQPLGKWWQEANAYQIWPASFQDSNGDGCGDIPGIISRLDYLKDLGVDLIWLSPVYDSPQHDLGYDISNYEDIWSKYGTLADMERLIKELKARDMRILMDLVVNHTSIEHAWFKESAKSSDKSNPYHDWYHWRDPKGIGENGKPIPPNNWRAAFGGSAWEYSETRKQFYLHLFLHEMADLNWFNTDTRTAIYNSAIEFWLKRGVDGFRVDVVNLYWKNLDFPDARVLDPASPYQQIQLEYTLNGPLMHPWLQEQRSQILDKYGDIMLVGEVHATPPDEILKYLSPTNRELDMIFDLNLFNSGPSQEPASEHSGYLHDWIRPPLTQIKASLAQSQGLLTAGKAWATTFLENHDFSRSIDRFGPGADAPSDLRIRASKTLALLIATLSGTLFMYQGQEIGMTNMPKSWTRSDLRDRMVLQYLDTVEKQFPDDPVMAQRALDAARSLGRDNARTPVQWSSEPPYAGFMAPDSKVEPWIQINPNYQRGINVAEQLADPNSTLGFWREMLRVRKGHVDILVHGAFEMLDEANERVFTYVKRGKESNGKILVVLNFSGEEQEVPGKAKREIEKGEGDLAGETETVTEPGQGRWKMLVSTLISVEKGTSQGDENGSVKRDVDVDVIVRLDTPLAPWEGRAFIYSPAAD